MAAAKESGCEIMLPVDAVVTREFKAGAESFIADINAIPKDGMIVDYGPKSVAALKERLTETKTVLWNGPLGAFEIEPFGGDTVLVSSYPAMLANLSPADLLRQVVELLLAGDKRPERRDLLDELLHMIACKAAVKAGDHLAPEEITALLEQRHCYQDAHHCPHGRPTALVFTREELDRRFKRT